MFFFFILFLQHVAFLVVMNNMVTVTSQMSASEYFFKLLFTLNVRGFGGDEGIMTEDW